MRAGNLRNIAFIKASLEIIFILIFLYSLFPFGNNCMSIPRIWIVTFSILALFTIVKVRLDKENLKKLFSPTIFFFIILSAAQTIKNINTPRGLPVLLYEIIHYTLTIFILFYNFREKRLLDSGLVLFIVYSFRIFDLRPADNEFVLIHGLVLILLLIWLEEICTKRKILPRINSMLIPLIILIIVAVFSTIKAACPYNSLTQAMVIINFIFVALLIAAYFKNIRQVNLLILTLFSVGGVLIILTMNEVLNQFVTTGNVGDALSRVWIGRAGNYPLTIHPNSIAGYFAALLCLVIGSLSFYKSRIIKQWAGFFIVIMFFVFLLTYSRLGILSFIFALSILLAFRYKRLINFVKGNTFYLTLSLIFIIALIALSPIKETAITRMHDSHSNSVSLYSCNISLAAIKDNFLFGAGLEDYYLLSKYVNEPIVTPAKDAITTTRNLTRSAPHSLYLGIAFGLGIIGLLIFIWLLINFITYSLKLNNYIHDDGYEKGLLQGVFVAFISIIVHGILSMTFHLTVLPAFFWIFIGIVISIGNITGYNKSINYELKSWKLNALLITTILISTFFVINPILAEKYYSSALNNFNSGQLNGAVRKINWAEKLMPINPKFYELDAEIQIKQGLIDEAIEFYKKALHLKKILPFIIPDSGNYISKKRCILMHLENSIRQ